MKTYVCSVCGYFYNDDDAPEKCPQCGAAKSKFLGQEGDLVMGRPGPCTGFSHTTSGLTG